MSSICFELSFSNVKGTKPSIQILAFDDAGNELVGSSNQRLIYGSMLKGGVTWDASRVDGATVCFNLRELERHANDTRFFPIVIHAPIQRSIADAADRVSFKLSKNARDERQAAGFRSEEFDLSEGTVFDWFVVGMAVINYGKRSFRFKNVASFPNEPGEVQRQLKDLIEWTIAEDSETEGWFVFDLDPTCPAVPAINDSYQDVTSMRDEISKLRSENTELSIKVAKQEIIIERLRKERREEMVTDLVGPETTLRMFGSEDCQQEDSVEKLLQSQENLIGSIKQQILRLSNQIKTGQRMRAIGLPGA